VTPRPEYNFDIIGFTELGRQISITDGVRTVLKVSDHLDEQYGLVPIHRDSVKLETYVEIVNDERAVITLVVSNCADSERTFSLAVGSKIRIDNSDLSVWEFNYWGVRINSGQFWFTLEPYDAWYGSWSDLDANLWSENTWQPYVGPGAFACSWRDKTLAGRSSASYEVILCTDFRTYLTPTLAISGFKSVMALNEELVITGSVYGYYSEVLYDVFLRVDRGPRVPVASGLREDEEFT
jgi:hypothetical protein